MMEKEMIQQDWNMVAEVELVYRSKIKPSQRPKITNVRSSYELLIQHWDKDKIELVEQFKVVLLNKANKVIGISTISTGGVSGTIADPRIIFALALKANACAVILSHSHPSGNLNPSEADKKITEKIKQAGLLLDILVMDHLIITSESYYSFADEGLI